ncbi:lytic transglycosylase domain-containing protein [uncultured Rhodospira sp.]|uniref:lytic transglycosylase domain-containing protein n=1 Tax=uncultured Rhodospira sp. TaxID=1936189 RepID=UPI00261A0340|nr:lytic transglycosylase domain-containing protein [uncultured Rhodospira sp.]
MTVTLARAHRTTASRSLARGLVAVLLALALWSVATAPAARSQTGPFQAALDALDDRNYDAALALVARLHDPVARKLVQWARLKEGLGTFETIAAFIDANPDWPHQYTLRRAAERALTGREDPRRLLAWFDRHPPLTTDGLVARAHALRATGQTKATTEAARTAWVEGRFSTSEERSFLRAFGDMLRREDHAHRVSDLLWDERITEAQRTIPRLDSGYQALANARIALIRRASGVDAAIARVPADLRDDPGLVYDRLVWRRKHNLHDRAVEMLFHPAANQGRPDAWARERALLGRESLQRGEVTRAYRLFANHGHDEGLAFAVGEWTAGWIALRFLDEPAKALTHFETLYGGVSYPQSLSRGAYWAGRAAAALGQREQAATWYRRAAKHAETFYGQLAIEDLGERLADHLGAAPNVSEADRARFAQDERAQVIALMESAGRMDMALPFVLALNDDPATPGFRRLAGEFVAGTDRPDMAVFFARRAALNGTDLLEIAYPTPADVLQGLNLHPPTGQRPEPALMLSLIRQESNFNTEAVSRAGARGLMQLMPRTAARVAQRLGETSSRLRLVNDPAHNTRLGTAYFASLLDQFRGSYVLAIAGYNAGPGRSRRWMQENGDPRRMDVAEVVDWIEMISFSETRNYVQRVLEGTQVYRHRLGQSSARTTLSDDLLR